MVPQAAARFAELVRDVSWITDVWITGSVASGDYRPGRSDIDLVALTARALTPAELEQLTAWHREIDRFPGPDRNLGCAYLTATGLADSTTRWPTWSHGAWSHRRFSQMARAELGTAAVTLKGRNASAVCATPTEQDVRTAVEAELAEYWTYALRHPWLFRDQDFCDLALLSMARARLAVRTGRLVTKSIAMAHLNGPATVRCAVRSRRDGTAVKSNPFVLASVAYADVRHTVRAAGVTPC